MNLPYSDLFWRGVYICANFDRLQSPEVPPSLPEGPDEAAAKNRPATAPPDCLRIGASASSRWGFRRERVGRTGANNIKLFTAVSYEFS
jgi:hypothetical protein